MIFCDIVSSFRLSSVPLSLSPLPLCVLQLCQSQMQSRRADCSLCKQTQPLLRRPSQKRSSRICIPEGRFVDTAARHYLTYCSQTEGAESRALITLHLNCAEGATYICIGVSAACSASCLAARASHTTILQPCQHCREGRRDWVSVSPALPICFTLH